MVLRKKRRVSEGGVPVELLDEHHPMWEGQLLRHRTAAKEYAIEQGWVRFYGANPQPFPDLNMMREAGIPTYACARLMREAHGSMPQPTMTTKKYPMSPKRGRSTRPRFEGEAP